MFRCEYLSLSVKRVPERAVQGDEGSFFKNFLIYTNRHKDQNLATTKRVADFLRLKGRRVTVMAEGEGESAGPEPGSGRGFPGRR